MGCPQCGHNQQLTLGLASDPFPIQMAAEHPTLRILPRESGYLYALPFPIDLCFDCRCLRQDLLWSRLASISEFPLSLNSAKDDLEVLGWRCEPHTWFHIGSFRCLTDACFSLQSGWDYRCEPPLLARLLKISDCTGVRGTPGKK